MPDGMQPLKGGEAEGLSGMAGNGLSLSVHAGGGGCYVFQTTGTLCL